MLLSLSVDLLGVVAKQFIAVLRWGPADAKLQLLVQMLRQVVQSADIADPIGLNGGSQARDHTIWNETFVLETTVIQRVQTVVRRQVMLLDRYVLPERVPLL